MTAASNDKITDVDFIELIELLLIEVVLVELLVIELSPLHRLVRQQVPKVPGPNITAVSLIDEPKQY